MAVIYARVSSEQQREENTIASQTAALIEFARSQELEVPKEWVFEDEGYSGATLERPNLERVRDLAAEGQIQVVVEDAFHNQEHGAADLQSNRASGNANFCDDMDDFRAKFEVVFKKIAVPAFQPSEKTFHFIVAFYT
jgi:hypothetical protein